MKTKINIISATLIIALAVGIAAYAHGPNGGNPTPYSMGMGGSSMMGGGGMMGGYGSGQGMMGGYGNNGDGHNRDMWDQNVHNSRDYRQKSPNFRSESESLINDIEEKRSELSSLLRSKNTDNALIDKKVKELNRLERYLDERIQ